MRTLRILEVVIVGGLVCSGVAAALSERPSRSLFVFAFAGLAFRDVRASILEGEQPERAVIAIVDTLRSWGMSFAPMNLHDLREEIDSVDGALQHHLSRALSNLAQFPDSSELTSMIGLHPRAFTRRLSTLARDYHMPWSHFRAALHHTRIVQALRLLAAPTATTESVARITGFRAPTALCHAFAKAGLPSPGVLGQAARKHALDAWTAFAA